MPDQQLIDYIVQQKSSGADRKSIDDALLKTGWSQESVNLALDSIFGKEDKSSLTAQVSDSPIETKTTSKPKVVKTISTLFWILALVSLYQSIAVPILIDVTNNSMKRALPALLDYSFMTLVPFLFPLISFAGIVAFLSLSYAALKATSGSRQAWRVNFIIIVGLFILGVINSLVNQ